MALVHWGDRYLADTSGPPIIHHHTTCGHDFKSAIVCTECGEPVNIDNVEMRRST